MKVSSLKELIGQMIVVRAAGFLFDRQIRYPAWEAKNEKLTYYLEKLNIGGVILLGGSAIELAARSQQLQNWAKTPLLIAADIEEGVGQRFPGATWFAPPMALSSIKDVELATSLAQKMGAVTAQEALAIGINWILAPVTDINNNPDNPVINVRAFGETPARVSELTTAFIQGCQTQPVLTTAKHFPGHGDTSTDSHLDLPILPHSRERLAGVELIPFQRAIAAGVDVVMTAHLLVPALDSQRPATLSRPILTDLLRQQMGFEGLIVTDALIMGGVAKYADPQEICLMAIEAGADILLMPDNPQRALKAIVEAVESGRLKEQQIEQSYQRISEAKAKLNLASPQPESTLSVQINLDHLSSPESWSTAATILSKSLLTGGKLPLAPVNQGLNLIIVPDLLTCDFLAPHTPAIAKPRQQGYELRLVTQTELADVAQKEQSQDILLQIFMRGNPFRGQAGLSEASQQAIKELLTKRRIGAMAIYGSPYILEWFRANLPSDLPWVFTYGQMPLAQEKVAEVLWDFSTLTTGMAGAFI